MIGAYHQLWRIEKTFRMSKHDVRARPIYHHKRESIEAHLIDSGSIASEVRDIVGGGVDTALELIGTPTLWDTLRATRVHGIVCFTGMLSNQWTVRDFYPIDYLPRGVRLTAYNGDAADLRPAVLQDFLDAVAVGRAPVPLDRVFSLDQIQEAHAYMEAGRAVGKLVVIT